jgi:hypothetical protein
MPARTVPNRSNEGDGRGEPPAGGSKYEGGVGAFHISVEPLCLAMNNNRRGISQDEDGHPSSGIAVMHHACCH